MKQRNCLRVPKAFCPLRKVPHAIRVAIDEALKCKETGEEKNILFGLTGTGYFDLFAYEKFNNGEMSDYFPTDEELEQALRKLPQVPEGKRLIARFSRTVRLLLTYGFSVIVWLDPSFCFFHPLFLSIFS